MLLLIVGVAAGILLFTLHKKGDVKAGVKFPLFTLVLEAKDKKPTQK